MKKQDIFKTNQDYLAEFFKLAGAQKRTIWEPQVKRAKEASPQPGKEPSEQEIITTFQLKVKRTLKAGLKLPLEQLAKTHNLTFAETCILAFVAGSELYHTHTDLGGIISGFEKKGIAPAFETARLLSLESPLKTKGLLSIVQQGYTSRPSEDISMPPSIFTLITGVELHKTETTKRQPAVKGADSPSKIYAALADYVVGQDQAKKAISAGVFLHLKRTELNKTRTKSEKITKSNILIIGPTGSGKTHICRTLSNALNLPFHIADATQYTETGYVGRTVEEMLLDLHKGRELPANAHGIIYIDEIDKIAAQNPGGGHSTDRDVSGKSVQEELLKLLEGSEISCTTRNGMGNARLIDASNIMFIAGGAFQGLEDIIKERLKNKGIGFRGASSEEQHSQESLLRQVLPEDLIAYGFMPEFVGRFPVIAVLDRLTKTDLVNIIIGTKNSILSQYQAVIAESGMDIHIPQDFAEVVAEAALKRDLGARAIKGIMENWLMEEIFKHTNARPPAAEADPAVKLKTIKA